MSLEKPPPSRYRVEEKDGRLIVHDSLAGDQIVSPAPQAQPRSALSGTNLSDSVSPSLASLTNNSGGAGSSVDAGIAAGRAKRSATVAMIGMGLVFFLFITGLWPIMAIAMLVPQMRKRLLDGVLPMVKRYIAEGRIG